MIKVYVLVIADPGKTLEVFARLKEVQGVVECHQVMGPYDIVVEIEVEELSDVPPLLSNHIRTIEGLDSTISMVTFPEGTN